MRITVIYTTQATSLTIETSEPLALQQMGQMGDPLTVRYLRPGLNVVAVGPGVFKLQPSQEVRVAADSPNSHVMTMSGKDDPPEPPKGLAMHVDRVALHQFLQSARSLPDI